MKPVVFFLVPLVLLAADESSLQSLFDAARNPTQRANACFALRGDRAPDTIAAMTRLLEDDNLLTCAATNLRLAGAVAPLQAALSNPKPAVRAAAARELGTFRRQELLQPLAAAAEDANLLVASNAVESLARYDDPAVIPYLRSLSAKGGIIGDRALNRLEELDSSAALAVARQLLGSPQVPDRLAAMRVIGAHGDSSDLPALRQIAATSGEDLEQRARGFGLMPPINLARAARIAIHSITSRK